MRAAFWFFAVNLIILGWIGAKHVESPYIEIGATATLIYFAWFLVIVPAIGVLENTLVDLADENTKS
jgi:ubiquinol-cytochrome c reductase cytochrome b subunit